jgi:hypothetical protein
VIKEGRVATALDNEYPPGCDPLTAYIQKHHPELTATYEEIVFEDEDRYYRELCQNEAVLERCGFSFVDSLA